MIWKGLETKCHSLRNALNSYMGRRFQKTAPQMTQKWPNWRFYFSRELLNGIRSARGLTTLLGLREAGRRIRISLKPAVFARDDKTLNMPLPMHSPVTYANYQGGSHAVTPPTPDLGGSSQVIAPLGSRSQPRLPAYWRTLGSGTTICTIGISRALIVTVPMMYHLIGFGFVDYFRQQSLSMDWGREKWQCEGLLQCSVYADWFLIIDEATQCQLIIIL